MHRVRLWIASLMATLAVLSACDSSSPLTAGDKTAASVDRTSTSFRLTPHVQPTPGPQPTGTPIVVTFDPTALTPAPACAGCLIVSSSGTTYAVDPASNLATEILAPPDKAIGLPTPPLFPSPDGRTMAYGCSDDGSWSPDRPAEAICLWGAGRSPAPAVTSSDLERPLSIAAHRITWSPDGTFFTFVAFVPDNYDATTHVQETDVYVHDVATRNTMIVAPGRPFHAVSDALWSPNSEYLALARTRNGIYSNLLVYRPGSDALQLIPRAEQSFATSIDAYVWSPDSQNMAFTWTTVDPLTPDANIPREFLQQHFLASADGGGMQELAQNTDGEIMAISPDNAWLLVGSRDPGIRNHTVHVAPVDGSAGHVLAEGFTDIAAPVFESAGGRVVFVGTVESPPSNPDRALYVVDVAGGRARRLPGDHNLVGIPLIVWSPDGRTIYFTGDGYCGQGGCAQGPLFAVDAAGNAPPVQLTEQSIDGILGWTN